MNQTLCQELAQLNLQPGQCQLVQVNGYKVEIRRVAEEEKPRFEDMVMLEPWADLGARANWQKFEGEIRTGNWPLPDPPVIPDEEGESA